MSNTLDFLAPKDAWDKLSMREQAAMMKVAVKNGIYDLQAIRQKYNEFAEGGNTQTDWSYNSWKKQIATHKGIDIDNDKTYDYEGFFHKYPQEAWAMLRDDPDAHFSDEFKTVYHPTFSAASQNNEGSIYSGVKHPIFNPEGLKGGTWSPDYKSFTMSMDGYRGPVSMDERKWYLENAEDSGVQLREANGSLPIYDNIPWVGVLPTVTITGNKHSIGGPLVDYLMNEYASGGKIHIKPENRGKFTALKKRTGHSTTWFKEHGTPAQKKMATFALNAAKWKHGEGGNLFYPGGDITYGQPFYSYDENGQKIDDTLNYNATIPEVVIIPDSRKTSAQRNEDERYRQRNLKDYDKEKSKEFTTKQIIQSQKDWENSFKKKTLDYAQAAATGIGIGADIVSGLPIYSSLKGASTLSRAETPLEYIEGGLWLTPMLGGTYQGIKPMFKTASKPINPTNLFEAIQFSTETPEVSGRLSETQQAAEKGRNKLLEWIQSPFYKQRLEEEPFYKFSNDIANEASTIVKDAPLDFSKTVREIDPSGNIAGTTKTRPALKVRDDGYRVFDLNTGLNVNIGSDLGSEAEDTTLHELLHYLTVNSKGIPESTSTMQIVDKGWMQPLEALYNPVGKNILRGKKWQSYILDQNDALLPKYDSVVDMVMNRPDEAKAALLKAGRTEAQADVAIKSLQDKYAYWADIQEQRAHLQELFISKIKPHLKNPNDAVEIESFLSQHPEILENSAPYNYIQEVRPGSLKQYAGYFASALSTLPFINKLTTNEQ